jgi:hypothetical protein
METVWKRGVVKPTFGSAHPKQGCPMPIGQVSGTSLKCRVEHAA